jgi:hypothetical protein
MDNWYPWTGGHSNGPVSPTAVVETKLRDGTLMKPYPSEGIIWTHYGQSTDIIEYRVINKEES